MNEKIAELKRLMAAADPSPVQSIEEAMDTGQGVTLHYRVLILGVRTLARAADTEQNRADFAYIAAAANLAPALLARVAELEAK